MQHVFLTNLAEDAHEHTSQYELIPLDSQERDALVTTTLTGPVRRPGTSLYLPVALSLTRLANKDSYTMASPSMQASPRAIPNSSSVAWPLSIFTTKPAKPLSIRAEKSDNDEVCRGRFSLIL